MNEQYLYVFFFFLDCLYLTLQEQDRINGKFSLNCFKFPLVFNKTNPFRLKSMRVTLKGEEVEGLSCDKSQCGDRQIR